MNELIASMLFYIHLINLAVALYIAKELVGLIYISGKATQKSLMLSLAVASLFLAVEILHLAGLLDFEVFALSQSIFVFILLVLLLQHYLELRKSLKIQEHFLKKKFVRGKLRDVD
ncbi:MAG: hypothetical protein QW275_00655 [Candidatus Anstonellaceae archaeon]